MRTKPATSADNARFNALCASSPNRERVRVAAAKFYANGGTFLCDADDKEHKAASDAWQAEQTAAGFHIAQNGLRVITHA